MMSYFSYFKYFNESNKLDNELKYINFEDSLLNLIYENRDIDLAKIIFPLVEDKSLLEDFINLLKKCFGNY